MCGHIKTVLIVIGVIALYFGVMFGTYMLFTKIDPYDPDKDYDGDGDENKGMAAAWPVVLPLFALYAICTGAGHIMDMIRKDMTGK